MKNVTKPVEFVLKEKDVEKRENERRGEPANNPRNSKIKNH
jgi:hypothetical protein